MNLFPQLMPGEARERVRQLSALSIDELQKIAARDASTDFSEPAVTYSPTGGTQIQAAELRAIADGVRAVAAENGYPTQRAASVRELGRVLTSIHAFDILVSIQLHRQLRIHPHEASKEGVWEFFTCVLLPDVVRWRFPGSGKTVEERFLGGARNVFSRLWWRAYLLSDTNQPDPYRFLKYLSEDELVQITERPLLGFNERLSKLTVEAFMEIMDRHKRAPRMELMREFQKHLNRAAPLMSFDAMDDADLRSWIRALFSKVALQPQLYRT